MSSTIQYARKVGGSLMVTIPREIAELENIQPGEMIQLEIKKIKKDWFGAAKGLSSLKKEEKLDIHDYIRR